MAEGLLSASREIPTCSPSRSDHFPFIAPHEGIVRCGLAVEGEWYPGPGK